MRFTKAIADGFEGTQCKLEGVKTQMTNKEDQERAKEILESLYFPNVRLRHNTITEAHSDTFEWILSGKTSIFKEWLQSSGGIFWVNGKAGSGKSTLMKFLVGHSKTKKYLDAWAIGSRLFVLDVYFWYLGTPLQRSEEGLLRSILLDILQAYPELMASVIPNKWKSKATLQDSWSLSELRRALENISQWGTANSSHCLP